MLTATAQVTVSKCAAAQAVKIRPPPDSGVRKHAKEDVSCPVGLTQFQRTDLQPEARRQQQQFDKHKTQGMAQTALRNAQQRHHSRMHRSAHPLHAQEQLPLEGLTSTDAESQCSTIRQFIHDSMRPPLLKRDEEIALANAMHYGDIAHQRLQDLSTQQPQAELANQAALPVSQPPPQLGNLLSEIHAGAVAKRRLIKASQGLVLKIVEPYSKQSLVPVDDLLMAGLHGLHTGLQKFDPARGNRLSTVTYMWISEAIRSAFREMAVGIWIPNRTKADANRIVVAASQYPESVRYNSDTMEQIRLEVGLTKHKFTSAMRAIQMQEMSLDTSTTRATVFGKEAEGDSLIDSIPADDTVDVEGNARVAALAVQEALHQLPGPEASYISYKYGLHDGLPLSRAQIAKQMGISDHFARKLEQRALENLRSLPLGQNRLDWLSC